MYMWRGSHLSLASIRRERIAGSPFALGPLNGSPGRTVCSAASAFSHPLASIGTGFTPRDRDRSHTGARVSRSDLQLSMRSPSSSSFTTKTWTPSSSASGERGIYGGRFAFGCIAFGSNLCDGFDRLSVNANAL